MNFNGENWLKQFLPDFIEHSSKHADVVVIDNGSTDDSLKIISSFEQKVNLVKLDHNLGFAGGYNEGLKQLDHEFFVIVNSDIQVTNGWLSPLLNVLVNNKNVVAVQPKILSFDRKEEFEYAGAAGGFIDKFGYPFCRGRIVNHIEKDLGQFNNCHEVFWASGACMAVKAKDFFEIGGFDHDFFAHMEEIDLCWRWKNKGKSIMYTSESVVYHVGGGTLSYESPQKTFLNFRNSLWMIHKNYEGTPPLLFKVIARMTLDQIAFFRFLSMGKVHNAISILKAHYHYYKSIRKLKKKRKAIPKMGIQKMNGYSNKFIIWEYFIKQNRTFKSIVK